MMVHSDASASVPVEDVVALIAKMEAKGIGCVELDKEFLALIWPHADEALKTRIVAVPYGLTTSIDASVAMADALWGPKEAISLLADAAMDCFELVLTPRDVPLALCIAILKALEAKT